MQELLYYSEMEDPVISWIFKFFSTAIGCRFLPTTEPHLASVVYSNMQVDAGQLQIPVWHGYYDSNVEHCLHPSGYWAPAEVQDVQPAVDYVGLVYRLLALVDELTLPHEARDQLGNLALNVNVPRLKFRDRPMVDEAVHAFKQKLVERGFIRDSELLPRWPNGKCFAVLITHDTDGPCLLSLKELAKAGLKGFARLNGSERQAFFEGCRRIIAGRDDPYFNFAHWAEFERTLNAKSAFYIYVKSKGVPGHLHNPQYRVDKSKTKWNILRELADREWEIGLHASIHALEKDEYIQAEKSDLEDFLGKPIAGNRCHYWRMNWQNPIESFRRFELVDFMYDCSMAWKATPGFRSGTVTPYHPYDPETSKGFKLLEIPTNIMDGHLFVYQKETDPHAWFASVVEHVKAHRGVLNLDWHTRTWVNKFSYAGCRSFLVEELIKLADTGEAWFTTPRNLSEYWLLREQQIEGV